MNVKKIFFYKKRYTSKQYKNNIIKQLNSQKKIFYNPTKQLKQIYSNNSNKDSFFPNKKSLKDNYDIIVHLDSVSSLTDENGIKIEYNS